jgi:hypothetical protein
MAYNAAVNPTNNAAIRTRKKAKRAMTRDRRYSRNREEINKADFGATECKLGEDITERPQDQQMAIADPLGSAYNRAPVCVITAYALLRSACHSKRQKHSFARHVQWFVVRTDHFCLQLSPERFLMQEARASEIVASPKRWPASETRSGASSSVGPGSASVRSSSRVTLRRPLRIFGLRVIAIQDASLNIGTSS